MSPKKEFIHPEFGPVRISINARARRIIMRADKEYINVTAPPFATYKEIERALAKYGCKLKEMQTVKGKTIDSQYSIGDGNFKIKLQEYKGENFMWVHNDSTATLMCPEKTDYNARQEWLRKVIVNAIHEEAKRFLLPRLRELAEKHGFKYSQCSVRNSHSRWGSCSGKGNISLSIYLVLLTEELIDYVLLHELCHTVEMNHGERFWAILDKTCGCNSKKIRNKLKRYTPDI